MIDLVVIGSGLSGLMAALTAAEAGRSVKVVAKGLGALHWSAATVDLLGYDAAGESVRLPFAVLDSLCESNPSHPYALLGGEQVRGALDAFQSFTAKAGLPYHAATAPGENLRLPSPVGAVRPAYLAPAAQLAGALDRDDPLLIVGFERMRDFYPALIAENLAKQGWSARAVELPFDLLTERRDANTVHLATELEQTDRAARLGEALERVVQAGERIGLPAILGLEAHVRVFEQLQTLAGAPLFEIPTLPPSVPGMRLHQALRSELERLNVRIEAGMEIIAMEATPSAADGLSQVVWVASETSARPLKHRADNFILATGGILGGGFESDHTGRVWETIFDLPLTAPQARSQWFHPRFLDERGHQVFRGGVAVDQTLRPVGKAGASRYANLQAVGATLAGFDPIVERSMEGVAIASGVAAASALASSG